MTDKVLCRYYMNGACRLGSECRFSHNMSDVPQMVCKFWLQGYCAYGDKCRYDHVRPEHKPKVSRGSPAASTSRADRQAQPASSASSSFPAAVSASQHPLPSAAATACKAAWEEPSQDDRVGRKWAQIAAESACTGADSHSRPAASTSTPSRAVPTGSAPSTFSQGRLGGSTPQQSLHQGLIWTGGPQHQLQPQPGTGTGASTADTGPWQGLGAQDAGEEYTATWDERQGCGDGGWGDQADAFLGPQHDQDDGAGGYGDIQEGQADPDGVEDRLHAIRLDGQADGDDDGDDYKDEYSSEYQNRVAEDEAGGLQHAGCSAGGMQDPSETALCSQFMAFGKCWRGDSCPHIHGLECETCHKAALHPYNEAEAEAHRRECRERHARLEARLRSANVECGICLEKVLSHPDPSSRRFGLMSCEHAFCLKCIRNWRASEGMDVDSVVRTCPICRTTTHFVTPSTVWPSSVEEKEGILGNYRAKLGSIDCRHFNFGDGACPFGTSCFYRHVYRDGRPEDISLRRYGNSEGEVRVLQPVRLSSFLETAVAQQALSGRAARQR